MPNSHIIQRLIGIQNQLRAAYQASAPLSNASKGIEREAFIDNFLGNVLPPTYRFGTGDATDAAGLKSGQLDVVIEYPFAPSLPAVGGARTRLYLAESVAAVIEVKSNVSNQWDEVLSVASQLAPLRRQFGMTLTSGSPGPIEKIPLFAVGYTGWTTVETCKQKLDQNPTVAGILVIDPGIFVTRHFGATGPWSLWGLISTLHVMTNSLISASTNPMAYLLDPQQNSP